jgi:hypothetical protein
VVDDQAVRDDPGWDPQQAADRAERRHGRRRQHVDLNGEIERTAEPTKRRWRLFGRKSAAPSRSNRPEDYL